MFLIDVTWKTIYSNIMQKNSILDNISIYNPYKDHPQPNISTFSQNQAEQWKPAKKLFSDVLFVHVQRVNNVLCGNWMTRWIENQKFKFLFCVHMSTFLLLSWQHCEHRIIYFYSCPLNRCVIHSTFKWFENLQ